MPEPKTYRPNGDGTYSVTNGGRTTTMRIDPIRLVQAGYVRERAKITPEQEEQALQGIVPFESKKYFQRYELMAGPKRSRQWIEDRWSRVQKLINDPERSRVGTTEVERIKPKPPPAEITDYKLTEKGVVSTLPRDVMPTTERGLPNPELSEAQKQMLETDLPSSEHSEGSATADMSDAEYLKWLQFRGAVRM